jgi:predicted kinase
MVVGVPGSGKTSIANQLAKQLINSVCLSKDLIQSVFTTKERVNGDTYAMIQGPTFYLLVEFSRVQIAMRKHPIIDAPFSINHWRKDDFSDWVTPFKKVAIKQAARLAIIRCLPPSLEVLKQRIIDRDYEWDLWKLAHWDEFQEREPVKFPIHYDDVWEVSSDLPPHRLVDKICLEYLQADVYENI